MNLLPKDTAKHLTFPYSVGLVSLFECPAQQSVPDAWLSRLANATMQHLRDWIPLVTLQPSVMRGDCARNHRLVIHKETRHARIIRKSEKEAQMISSLLVIPWSDLDLQEHCSGTDLLTAFLGADQVWQLDSMVRPQPDPAALFPLSELGGWQEGWSPSLNNLITVWPGWDRQLTVVRQSGQSWFLLRCPAAPQQDSFFLEKVETLRHIRVTQPERWFEPRDVEQYSRFLAKTLQAVIQQISINVYELLPKKRKE